VRPLRVVWILAGGAFGFTWARRVIKRRAASSLLTDRQLEILALVARGMSSKEIALHEGISANSVDTHIRRARLVLGVSTRAAAAAAVSGREVREGDQTGTPARPRRSATRSSAITTSLTSSSNGI
jgi:DNA-binding CsgD family transcriptional regulator